MLINESEIVGFLGANGAGKSTTLKMITGYLSPSSGNVHVGDKNILDNCIDIQKMIGYLPELNPLYAEMKVHEYLKFHASIREITGNKFNEALKRVVKECSLQGVVHRTIGNCSKGYKQRIGLAAAMIHDPKILILDEATSALDYESERKVCDNLSNSLDECTVFFITHRLSNVKKANLIIMMHQGMIDEVGTHEELIDKKGRYYALYRQQGDN